MICRIDIKGRKIWLDDNNAKGTRPLSVEINLLRDGEVYKTTTVYSDSDGVYNFFCLPVYNNTGHKYRYSIDENPVPAGYTKAIQGYNVINTHENITITGTKTWKDNNNVTLSRPVSIVVNLLQNNIIFRSMVVISPPGDQETVSFSFTDVPFADNQGNPFVYTVDEETVQSYTKEIKGLNIINTII